MCRSAHVPLEDFATFAHFPNLGQKSFLIFFVNLHIYIKTFDFGDVCKEYLFAHTITEICK